MSRLLLLGLPVLFVVVVLAAVLAGRRRAGRLVFDEDAYPGLVALRRATTRFRWVGLGIGLLAGIVLVFLGSLAPFVLVAPIVVGLSVVVAIMVGQQLSYAKARVVGVAAIETRRVRDYLPPRSLARLAGAVVVLLAVLGYTTLVASPDDMGRAGRAISATWASLEWNADANGTLQPHEVTFSSTYSPFPGSFYTTPVLPALTVLLAVAVLALALTARRPRNGADPELVRVDDALRRITAQGIVAAAGLGVAGTLFTAAAWAYPQLGKLVEVPAHVAAAYVLAAVALGALVLTLAFAVTLLVPGTGERS